jgi:hypothetical protein
MIVDPDPVSPWHQSFGQIRNFMSQILKLFIFFGGLECVGHSFAYVAHILFLRDVWIRAQRAAVATSKQARY